LKEIAAALKDANKPDDTTKPCGKNEDNRSSDLCAQWKAADAARGSAIWAERTFWLGIGGLVVGFLTLIAAGAAAFFAHKAAVETQKGANAAIDAVTETRNANAIAREALEEQDRPWLKVEAELSGILQIGLPKCPSVNVSIHVDNIGRSPAVKINVDVEVFINPSFRCSARQRDISDRSRKNDKGIVSLTLFPGDKIENFVASIGLREGELAAFMAKNALQEGENITLPLSIVGCVQYQFTTGGPKHQTGFSYNLRKRPHTPISLGDLPISAAELLLVPPIDGPGVID